MNELTWVPRGHSVVLRALLKPGIQDKLTAFKADDAEEVIDEETIFDLVDENDNFHPGNYRYFIHDKGEEVKYDLDIGDEVLFDFHNLREVTGESDRSLAETYFLVVDGAITMRKPGSINI
jgi:hypothetical protein